MGKGVIVVHSNPESADTEAAYNQWYNGTHIDELTANGLCHKVTRYKVSNTQIPGVPAAAHHYLAVYEFDDLEAGFADMASIKTTPGPIDAANSRITLFEKIFTYEK